uniref:Dinoflagellate viral nucleoprotein DVNP.12 n=1 Tax=Hematodinium sp. SG-2012 TaxID=1263730 RepID=K9NVJ6_9DINO|nr:dinoflagellate viral nucleoprotein DVNP.12 [Hematodinium sp. SG-2012]
MAKPMKMAMKSAKKSSAKKTSAKKTSAKKTGAKKTGAKKTSAMKKKTAKRVSKVAHGKRAKSSVFRGTKEKTGGGLHKSDLCRNKNGKIVSKKASDMAKKRFKKNGLDKFIVAVQKARKALNIKGFQAVGGKSAKGQALLKKARSFYSKK